jgi:hypothetical protein
VILKYDLPPNWTTGRINISIKAMSELKPAHPRQMKKRTHNTRPKTPRLENSTGILHEVDVKGMTNIVVAINMEFALLKAFGPVVQKKCCR